MVSTFARSKPELLTAIGNVLFWEPAHWIMQTRQFTNLKPRAERPTPTAEFGAPDARSADRSPSETRPG